MKRIVIVIGVALALFAIIRVSGPAMIYGLENSLYRPLSFTTGLPGPVLWIGSVILVAIILRRTLGGRRYEARHRNRQSPQQDSTSSDGAEVEDLARDLERTARNLEKRLEALETILLDRTETRL